MTEPRPCVAFDTETFLISPIDPWPRVVCLSVADENGAALVAAADTPMGLLVDTFRSMLAAGDYDLIAHQSDYDLGVLSEADPRSIPAIFQAIDADRIKDTKLIEQLKAIENGSFRVRRNLKGGFSLETLARDRLGVALDKGDDGWRLRYAELIAEPSDQWPERAAAYAKEDARSTRAVYLDQISRGYQPRDLGLQVQSQWALGLMKRHGIVTDGDAVDALEAELLEKMIVSEARLKAEGLIRTDGSRDMKLIKARIERAYEILGEPAPRTDRSSRFPDGQIQTSRDALEPVEGIDDGLDHMSEFLADQKVLGTFVPVVRRGVEHAIHPGWNVLVESGRTSCSGDAGNLQNLPRKIGARECIVARPGKAFVSIDYEVAELRALAQVCYTWFGHSALREAFAQGRDPHLELGASILGVSYGEIVERKKAGDPEAIDARQFAKIPNFGFPGGLGAETFRAYAKGYGYKIDSARAEDLKAQWRAQWPEMIEYFRTIAWVVGDDGPRKVEQFGSGRVRGDLSYTQAANSMFQGLVADVAKRAHYLVTRACYVHGFDAELFGARPVLFAHDEIVIECDAERVHEVATAASAIMLATEAEWMPDVPPAVEAKASRNWAKGAKRVLDGDGRLQIWEQIRAHAKK